MNVNFITLDGVIYNCAEIQSVQRASTTLTIHFTDKSCINITNFDAEEDCQYYFGQLQRRLTGFVGDQSSEWRLFAVRKRQTTAAAEKGV